MIPDPSLEPSGLEVVELSWERIQLTARVCPAGSREDAPAPELFLRHLTEPAPPLQGRPVHGGGAARGATVRFNPFAAADQMPVRPGLWQLVAGGDGRESPWRAVPAAGGNVAPWRIREFPYGSSMIRFEVRPPERASDPLTVEITTWRQHVPGQRTWTLEAAFGRARRLKSAIRHGLFGWLVKMCRALPGGRRLVVFTSDSRATLGGNLALIHERMVERGLDRKFDLRTILRPSLRTRRAMIDRARLVWLLARARVVLLEDYQPAVYRLEPRIDRRIIQLWHAWGAFKTVGYSRIGKAGGLSPYARAHKNYTYAVVSSEHEVPFYAEAFGLPEERIVPTGTPRMDDFLDRKKQAQRRDAAYAALPLTRGREVFLFAPTFRGSGARAADYPVEMLDLRRLHALCSDRNAVALVRLHPFVERRVEIAAAYRDHIVDATDVSIDTNDLLLISDLLVTDYSSLIFEYAALGRPMLFFAYDQDEYIATRDFYEPYETFVPGRIVRTFDELVSAIRARDYQHEKVEPFARRHLPSEPGSATDRIIDQLILGR